MRLLTMTAAALMAMGGAALADPIVGNWKTKSGETAAISSCGGAYCVTLKTGKYAGKRIGKFNTSGNGYKGSITDPENDKTYNGKASLNGSTLVMKGCVLGGLICRGENWSKM